MNAPAFTDAQIRLVCRRIESCQRVLLSIPRKRSWTPSVRAITSADYEMERDEWAAILATMQAHNACLSMAATEGGAA